MVTFECQLPIIAIIHFEMSHFSTNNFSNCGHLNFEILAFCAQLKRVFFTCWVSATIYPLIVLIYTYDGVRRVSELRREPVVSMEKPTLIPTSHCTGKEHLDPVVADSDHVPCTEHPHRTRNEMVGVCNERVRILIFSGMWRSVWRSSRQLQVPYVIPRSGVPHHIY